MSIGRRVNKAEAGIICPLGYCGAAKHRCAAHSGYRLRAVAARCTIRSNIFRSIPEMPATRALPLLVALAAWSCVLQARDIPAAPDTYLALLGTLQAGDRLILAPGEYTRGLRLHGIAGRPGAPISILGPASGPRARFLARDGANTVSLRDAAHLVIDSIELEGLGRNADAVKAEAESRYAHHITLSRLRITGHDADQLLAGIAIQSPAWDWEIRDCEILGAGTGMYLGRSNGSAGLVGGVIERNVVRDTLGYNLQIKHQTRRADAPGMPSEPRMIVVRHNVFSKRENAAGGQWARPNVLVGHFPASGPGAEDMHVIYGNVFYENPVETLFQGEGNLTLYNNVFVNSSGPAVSIQPHNGRPRRVAVFNNTILSQGRGLAISGLQPGFRAQVMGNIVFAGGAAPPAIGPAKAPDAPAKAWARISPLDSGLRRNDDVPVAPAKAGAQVWPVNSGLRRNNDAPVAPAKAGAQALRVDSGFRRNDGMLFSWEAAADYLRAPYAPPPLLDVSPLDSTLQRRQELPEDLARLPDIGLDLSGTPRHGVTGGAYLVYAAGRPISLTRPPVTPN